MTIVDLHTTLCGWDSMHCPHWKDVVNSECPLYGGSAVNPIIDLFLLTVSLRLLTVQYGPETPHLYEP